MKKTDSSCIRGHVLGWLLVVVVLAAGVSIFALRNRKEANEIEPSQLYTVGKEKLRISVLESGQLQSADSEDIYSQVRGSTTILKIVEEGTYVNAGDLVVELDTANIEEELTSQKIRYEQARAAWVQASESKAIQESINRSNIARTELNLALARTDLEKFEKGDWPMKIEQADENIALYEVELKTSEQTLNDTRELVGLDFAAQTELERDELDFKRAEVNLKLKEREKQIMEQYEFQRELQVRRSDITEYEAELDRVNRQAKADLAQKEAELNSKEATLELEETKLNRLKEQIDNARIFAPTAGLAVYPGNSQGRHGSDRDRIEEGATVRERQLLISLPDTSKMLSELQVHESAIDKVELGQPCIITIDALPDESFFGKVSFVAPLPDSQNQWLNPDLKVYRVQVALSGDTNALRPGMSVACEIVVEELEDALSVPVHAVHRKGSTLFCYLAHGHDIEIRQVQIGLNNENRVAILEGLSEGDVVYLATPAGAPEPEFPDEDEEAFERVSMEELRNATAAIEVSPLSNELKPAADKATDDDMKAGMEKFQNASPEERKRMMAEWQDRMKDMSPEEMEKMKKRFEGGGKRGGRPGSDP